MSTKFNLAVVLVSPNYESNQAKMLAKEQPIPHDINEK